MLRHVGKIEQANDSAASLVVGYLGKAPLFENIRVWWSRWFRQGNTRGNGSNSNQRKLYSCKLNNNNCTRGETKIYPSYLCDIC